MKTIILSLVFAVAVTGSSGQTFTGRQTAREGGHTCSIRINPDSSVVFVCSGNLNAVYEEYAGKITKASDSVYKVSATMTLGQFYMRAFDNDTIYIQLDSAIAPGLDKILVEYTDGKTRKLLRGYDRSGKPISLLKVPVDKRLLNGKKGTDYFTLTINRKDFPGDKFLSFKIPFGSAASFTSGRTIEFEVTIKDNQLWTVGKPPLQTGHFRLGRKKDS